MVDSANKIPRWLAINWWWLLVANVLEEELRAHVHHGASTSMETWVLTAWGLLQAGWLRSVDGRSRAIFWYAAAAAFDVFTMGADFLPLHPPLVAEVVTVGFFAASIAAAIIGIFVFRFDMTRYFLESEGVDLDLRWWMALLFSDFYFQYHFHQLAEGPISVSSRRITPGPG